jgi:hypothetical protein
MSPRLLPKMRNSMLQQSKQTHATWSTKLEQASCYMRMFDTTYRALHSYVVEHILVGMAQPPFSATPVPTSTKQYSALLQEESAVPPKHGFRETVSI